MHFVALFIALVLNASANLLMRIGMIGVQGEGGMMRDGVLGAVRIVLTSTTLLVGLICFGLNAFFYMYALQSPSLKISLAYPIMVGGGFALIAVVAHYHPALQESLNWTQKLGVALVLGGILLITSSTKA